MLANPRATDSRAASWRLAVAAAAAVAAFACTLAAPPAASAARPASAARSPLGGLPPGVPAAALRPEPTLASPRGWPFPGRFPRTSGSGRLSGGALLWSDFIYDDHGAAGAGPNPTPTNLAASNGSYRYPSGPAHNNGADVFRVAIGLTREATWWRVDWNTLADTSVPIASFALDTDGDPSTGAASWPGIPGLEARGSELALAISARGAWLVRPDGTSTPVTSLGGSLHVDRAARSFYVRLPRRRFPVAGTWIVRLAAGLATPDGRSFAAVTNDRGALPGQPPVYDLGIQPARLEPLRGNFWMEDAQAAALAAGDAGPFATTVRWRDLARRITTSAAPPSGYSNRWYVSSIAPGEGVVADSSPTGDLRPNFLGRVQPFGIWVAHDLDRRRPAQLVFLLHSLGVQHNQYSALNPHFVEQVCDRPQTICASPLGRGPDGWWLNEAELDFFEVWRSLAHDFRLDPGRTIVAGYSMGGFGAYRFALGYPDLFAKAVALAGPPIVGIRVVEGLETPASADGPRVDTAPLVENARWVPFFIGQGAIDELVPVTGVLQQVDRFERLGYRYRFELYPAKDHLAWAAEDAFEGAIRFIDRSSRNRAPGSFVLVIDPKLARPDLGVGAQGAWWLGDVRARSPELARIEARSGLLRDPSVESQRTVEPVSYPGGSNEAYGSLGAVLGRIGEQLGGLVPEPALAADPTAGVRVERRWLFGPPQPRTNAIALHTRNVESASLRMRDAGRRRGEAVLVSVASDGPWRLRLEQLEPRCRVTLADGRELRADRSGTVTVSLAAGTSEFTVCAAPSATPRHRSAPRSRSAAK